MNENVAFSVIKEAIELCKNNIKSFMVMSLIFLTIPFLSMAVVELDMSYVFGADLWWLIGLIKFIVVITSIWLIFRMTVAFYFVVSDAYSNIAIGVKEAFRKAKGHTASLFAAQFGLLLILSIPSSLMVWAYRAKFHLTTRLLLLTVGLIAYLILGTKYGLAPVSSILDSRPEGEFESSSRMTKGILMQAMIVVALSSMLTPINFAINEFSRLYVLSDLVNMFLQGIKLLLTFILTPLQTTLIVCLFYKLKDRAEPEKELLKVEL